ncbi:hypothetical protein K32_28080 [Kaistia sp. 32K]|uniref:hypothetical protein n=1 Tax=Kaistia sp. 32K TaxID=2795690 RepID=UPI001915798D|nr:hypothetical protein [Kaistia sp. 32K]BCP54191.1 hypothetical protein K32_28080 [Kaistia sp. 32K]
MSLFVHPRLLTAVFGLTVAMALGTGAALALSNDAQAIVDRVKATTPNLKPVCSDRGQLTKVVTAATIALAEAKKINGDHAVARAAGQEAGRYLYFHCS